MRRIGRFKTTCRRICEEEVKKCNMMGRAKERGRKKSTPEDCFRYPMFHKGFTGIIQVSQTFDNKDEHSVL
ncbi:hypothetical protein DPMN_047236 [Dreissena polymorpha]|uniref:Uncharacterized protein n=1 Tax=Dreissena polymorpha TaxID=45954 RepID=A0A9D4HYY6_DREPO|nr:hypothetical protein DPMN_047236 [Dreissena polymorpha]